MRIRIVDAFTAQPFSGAPAGVLLLDTFPADAWMQRVAAEVNHAETAFLHPLPAGGDADWALRWFTPTVEVALCGHATLAAAHVLASARATRGMPGGAEVAEGGVAVAGGGAGAAAGAGGGPPGVAGSGEAGVAGSGATEGPVRFATRSGVLTASFGPDGLITLNFPTAPLTPVEVVPGLAEALGAQVEAVHHTGPDTDDLLVELADEKAVRSVSPDLRALVPLSGRGVIVTAAAERDAGYDFVSRFFGPAVGVDEDPVTGSAHTALAPYWAAKLGRTELTGYQASPRGGFVRVALRGDRTEISGRAVTVIDGTLHA